MHRRLAARASSILIALGCGFAPACTRTVPPDDAAQDARDPLVDAGPIGVDAMFDTPPDHAEAFDASTIEADVGPLDAGPPCDSCPPRAVSPPSASVTSPMPTFRWVAPANADLVRIEVCAERLCVAPEWSADVAGDTTEPTTPLARGLHFWRLSAHDGTGWHAPSAPWSFLVEGSATHRAARCSHRTDLNGDGIVDLAIGMPALSGSGHVAIYLGRSTGFAGAPDITLAPVVRDQNFGTELVSAGDVDGDGYGDLLVSSGGYTPSQPTYLYRGTSSGIADTPSRTWSDPSGNGSVQYAKWSIRSGGDFNRDGFADVVLSAAPDGIADAAYVYYGRATDLPTVPDRTLLDPGSTAMSQFGRCTAGVGDVNGDGYDDLAVGASTSRPNGVVYIYYGSGTGIGSSPSLVVGDPLGGDMGCPLAAAGDVDADGYADIIATGLREGRVFVVRGGAGALTAVPLGTPPNHIGGPFGYRADCLGDIDGDSFDDIGVPGGAMESSAQVGALFVYRGSASGATSTAFGVFAPSGSPAWDNSVRWLGDIDGDGFDDVAVGAERLEAGPDGRVFIYRGIASGLDSVPMTTLASPGSLIGASLANVFRFERRRGG